MKKVLVPVDFSSASEHAMNFASEICKLTGGEVTLLHILESPYSGFSVAGEMDLGSMQMFYQGEFIRAVHDKLEDWRLRLEEGGTPVVAKMKEGHAFQNISKTIAEVDADLVVMGSNGASGLKEIFVGSNAAKTVRHAKCPVIVIKQETHVEDLKSLVFATDTSHEQESVVDEVKQIQKLLDVNLHVLKVKTPYNWLKESQMKAQLDHFSDRNEFEEYSTSFIDADFVDEGALKFAEEQNAGMVLIGTHGRTGLGHLIGGSISESIVNESKIPVMVMKLKEDTKQ